MKNKFKNLLMSLSLVLSSISIFSCTTNEEYQEKYDAFIANLECSLTEDERKALKKNQNGQLVVNTSILGVLDENKTGISTVPVYLEGFDSQHKFLINEAIYELNNQINSISFQNNSFNFRFELNTKENYYVEHKSYNNILIKNERINTLPVDYKNNTTIQHPYLVERGSGDTTWDGLDGKGGYCLNSIITINTKNIELLHSITGISSISPDSPISNDGSSNYFFKYEDHLKMTVKRALCEIFGLQSYSDEKNPSRFLKYCDGRLVKAEDLYPNNTWKNYYFTKNDLVCSKCHYYWGLGIEGKTCGMPIYQIGDSLMNMWSFQQNFGLTESDIKLLSKIYCNKNLLKDSPLNKLVDADIVKEFLYSYDLSTKSLSATETASDWDLNRFYKRQINSETTDQNGNKVDNSISEVIHIVYDDTREDLNYWVWSILKIAVSYVNTVFDSINDTYHFELVKKSEISSLLPSDNKIELSLNDSSSCSHSFGTKSYDNNYRIHSPKIYLGKNLIGSINYNYSKTKLLYCEFLGSLFSLVGLTKHIFTCEGEIVGKSVSGYCGENVFFTRVTDLDHLNSEYVCSSCGATYSIAPKSCTNIVTKNAYSCNKCGREYASSLKEIDIDTLGNHGHCTGSYDVPALNMNDYALLAGLYGSYGKDNYNTWFTESTSIKDYYLKNYFDERYQLLVEEYKKYEISN